MKESYDFSKGERGKFYNQNAEFELPICLEPDVIAFFQNIADINGTDIQSIANEWIRTNIDRIATVKN